MTPRITVVTPSFRQLEWLKLCAASVADQKDVAVEHIVQDAGTGPELETWAATQPGVQLHVEKDGGMYDAVNRGLRRAKGEICAYLNCDEQYLPGALRKVVQWFDTHPEHDLLFGDGIVVDAGGNPLAYRRVVKPTMLHTRLMFSGTLSCAMFFRRSLLDRGVWFNTAYRDNGDAVWVYDALRAGARPGTIHEPLAIFTMTGANMSMGENPRREYERWNAEPGAPPMWLKKPAIAWHWVKKACAGAYGPRDVDIEIFTRETPLRRSRFRAQKLTPRWPS